MVNLFCPNCRAQNECPDETPDAVNCWNCGQSIPVAVPAPTLNLPPEPGAEESDQSRESGPAPTLDLPPEPGTELSPQASSPAETTRTTAERSTIRQPAPQRPAERR